MAIDYPPVFVNNYLSQTIPNTLPYFGDPARVMKFFPTQPTSIDALTEEFPEAADDVFVVYDRMFRMRRMPFPHCRTEQLLYYFYKTAEGPEALIETVQLVADLLDNGDESAEDLNSWIKEKLNSQGNSTVYETRKTIPFIKKSLTSNEITLTTNGSHYFKPGDVIVVSETGRFTDAPTSFAGTHQVTEVTLNTVTYAKTGVDVAERDPELNPSIGIGHPTLTFGNRNFFLPYFQEFKIYQLEEARDIIDFGTARTYAGNKVIIEYMWHKSTIN